VTVTINADDPRTIKAIELAAEADQWLTGRNALGEDIFGVPSQSDPGRYYIVTLTSCDCPDFQHNETQHAPARLGGAADNRACKHVLAVRLHIELVRAQRHLPQSSTRSRGHLRVITQP
jgi:hypothetical protein